ncbi:MAG TPA: DinB family protein [Terracidiphilus sp.]|nr:DinB family protein [Terracidiphilus sp.]
MARATASVSVVCDLGGSLVESFAVSERMNQIVLENLEPAAWRAKMPASRTRTIAAIFAHMHNVRMKWTRLSAPAMQLPVPLQAARCTQKQAQKALKESGARCCELLAGALVDGRVKQFHRDGWARKWPACAAMAAYMLTHDAHHRGQVMLLAHQLGFPLPDAASQGLWQWERLWRECGFEGPR